MPTPAANNIAHVVIDLVVGAVCGVVGDKVHDAVLIVVEWILSAIARIGDIPLQTVGKDTTAGYYIIEILQLQHTTPEESPLKVEIQTRI